MPLYMRMTSPVTTLLLALAPFVPSSVLTCPFSFYIFNILLPLNFAKYIRFLSYIFNMEQSHVAFNDQATWDCFNIQYITLVDLVGKVLCLNKKYAI